VIRHIKTALFVGVILNLINQQNLIWGLEWHELEISKMVLTFFVTFAVSVYSAATSSNSKYQEKQN
jgi:hypothetical protein